MRPLAAVWTLVAALGAPAALPGQETLSDAAAREKARRANQGATKGRRFTDDDLQRLPQTKSSPQDAGAASASPPSDGGTSGETSAAENELNRWRMNVAAAREGVALQEAELKELEAQIREARAESVRPTRIGSPNREAAIARDITELLAQVDAKREAIEQAKQALEDLIEEARVAGVPYSQLD